MYATAEFDFNQADNGWLMSEFAFTRSIYLILMFPPLISWGRRWVSRRALASSASTLNGDAETVVGEFPTSPGAFDTSPGNQVEGEPIQPPKAVTCQDGSKFDLIFLRWSLVVDGALTTLAAFATERWHIYLSA